MPRLVNSAGCDGARGVRVRLGGRGWLPVVAVMITTGLCGSAHGRIVSHAAAAKGLATIRARIEAGIAAGRYPGAVFAVARGGRVLDLEAAGFADDSSRALMRTDSIFRSMSMTKPITAVAAMMMVEEGKLNLDEPVARVLPEFSGWGVAGAPALTLRHLLTHTSGIGFGSIPFKRSTLEARVRQTAARKMEVPAGREWAYSGFDGPDVVARMIEVAAGEPYDHFVRRRIFEPLGMKDTGWVLSAGQQLRLVALYAAKDGKVTPASLPLPDVSYPSGGAGLYTTAPDYLRFAQMLAENGALGGVRILKPSSVAELRGAQLPAGFPGLTPGTGFGLLMRRVVDPVAAGSPLPEGAYGWSGAYGTHFWVDPKTKLSAVWMVNLSTAGGAGSPDAHAFEQFVMTACARDRRCAR